MLYDLNTIIQHNINYVVFQIISKLKNGGILCFAIIAEKI